MSTEGPATGAAAPDFLLDDDSIAVVHPQPQQMDNTSAKHTGLHSPPDSNNDHDIKLEASDSELSDIDDNIANADDLKLGRASEPQSEQGPEQAPELVPETTPEDDIGEVLPDHWSGTVAVFKPTMHQFKDFKKFMEKVDPYGMKSGIVKIIPPQEWRDELPDLHDLVKQVRVREPIKQDIMGSNGTYRQVNFLHQRSYNIPQWRQLCDQSEHQPPARRGERRANAEKPKPATRSRAAPAANKSSTTTAPAKRGRGRRGRGGRGGRGGGRGSLKTAAVRENTADSEDRPMTPVSPKPAEDDDSKVVSSIEQDPGIKEEEGEECEDIDTPVVKRMGFSRQAKPKVQSTSARRKYSKREGSAMIDEAAFKDWDYQMDISDYTPERCEELERTYWRTLTYAQPLYGADLMGTLFDDSTEHWNLNKLPNLLDVLGTKVPGVNTAYLYLGMWKATFAWHLEDVDLYSINFLHFGAPKQWYSISQADARRFEAAMKSIWPTDAKACDQFLRHKAFLISPAHLQQHFNIKVNKVVSYPGEFVVTYPYGYHSGYNLGYNCAEAVNFALDSWLPMGKIAKKCECAQAQDSVWVDVYEIERKLRGEPTPEYWDTEDEDDEDDDDEDDDDDESGLPSPSASHTIRIKASDRKRKRAKGGKDGKLGTGRKIRLRVKAQVEPPCCLCPNDIPGAEILSTDDGRKAHRLCALYLPETFIETINGTEVISNMKNIEKARLELKCLYCRSKRGACFQCSQKKCPRSYHATCAAAAGVFVEEEEVPVFDENGIEYKEQAFEFSCRFHRSKRDKKLDADALDDHRRTKDAASALRKGDICQMQYHRKEIFAGVVVENRHDEQTLLLDVIPNGERVEVEWRWLLLPDPADFRLPKASANALPMPTSLKAKDALNAKRSVDEAPRASDLFVPGLTPGSDFTWAEFHTCEAAECANGAQVKVDMAKDEQVWHYLGKTSTESKAQYTENPRKPQHNTKSNFLDSVPKPPPPSRPQYRPSYGATHPAMAPKSDKPYVYKPRKPINAPVYGSTPTPFTSQKFAPAQGLAATAPQLSFGTDPRFNAEGLYAADRFTPVPNNPYQPRQMSGHTAPMMTPGQQPQATYSQPQSVDPAWLSQTPTTARFQPIPGYAPPNGYGQQRSTAAMQQQMQPAPSLPPAHQQPAQQQPVQQPLQHTWQKYAFFHIFHERESSRYRTPYSPWGGFTNGYEGDLRKHLTKKPADTASFKNRRLSFGLGGGLQGLTKPPSHHYSNSAGSSRSSPYSSSHQRSLSGAASPASSYGSGQNTSMSPPPYTTRGHQRVPSVPSAPLHPAIRPQFGPSWQKTYNGTSKSPQSPGSQQMSNSAFPQLPGSPSNPLPNFSPAGIPSQQPTFLNTNNSPPLQHADWSPTPQHTLQNDPLTHESPAQQLKQQLRRISDAGESPFRMPRSRGHTPRSSLSQLPQTFASPQQEQVKQEPRLLQQHTTPLTLAANGVAVREFPEAPPDSMALVEKMMLNLRRASEQDAGA